MNEVKLKFSMPITKLTQPKPDTGLKQVIVKTKIRDGETSEQAMARVKVELDKQDFSDDLAHPWQTCVGFDYVIDLDEAYTKGKIV